MANRKIWVRVPASSGNLGPGFDVLGAALKLYNELEIEITPASGIEVKLYGPEGRELPRTAQNMAVRTALKILERRFPENGFRFKMIQRIPLARGLGSSAAARLASYAAAYALIREKNKTRALEEAVREEGHPDNAAASFYGGLCACLWNEEKKQVYRWKMPRELKAVLCIPDFELSTSKARRALPKKVELEEAVGNLAGVAGILGAISHKRYEGLQNAMQDFLHQPYRSHLIPGFARVLEGALNAGALGACLSGAGSSILALAHEKSDPERIGRAMKNAFKRRRVASQVRILDFDNQGIKVQ